MYHYDLPQLLTEAMQHERACERTYQLMAAAAPLAVEQDQLTALRRAERRHWLVLAGIYEELTGVWDEGGPAAASLPAEYPEMLRTAVCDKLSGVVLYEQLIAVLSCARQKEQLCQIMNDEKQQARILAALYQKNHQPRPPRRQAPLWWEPGYRPYKY